MKPPGTQAKRWRPCKPNKMDSEVLNQVQIVVLIHYSARVLRVLHCLVFTTSFTVQRASISKDPSESDPQTIPFTIQIPETALPTLNREHCAPRTDLGDKDVHLIVEIACHLAVGAIYEGKSSPEVIGTTSVRAPHSTDSLSECLLCLPYFNLHVDYINRYKASRTFEGAAPGGQ